MEHQSYILFALSLARAAFDILMNLEDKINPPDVKSGCEADQLWPVHNRKNAAQNILSFIQLQL